MEFQKSVIFIKNCVFVNKKKKKKKKKKEKKKDNKNLIFIKNVLFPIRNTKIKTASQSHSDHPLKRHGRFCVSHFEPFYCLMQFALENASLC